jgi:hypothetical protein
MDQGMSNIERNMLPSLLTFFKNPDHFAILEEIHSPDSPLTVSLLNWFNTNYSKQYAVQWELIDACGRRRNFNAWAKYLAACNGYKKSNFDPFARGKEEHGIIISNAEGVEIETTIRQLNYLRWAIDNRVIDYVRKHAEEIHRDMKKRSGDKKKLKISSSKTIEADKVKVLVDLKDYSN